MSILNNSVATIKGIGEKKREQLEKVGITTIGEFLDWLPRDYCEYGKPKPIVECEEGETASIRVTFISCAKTIATRNRLKITKIKATDMSEDILCVWFNQPYIAKRFELDKEYVLTGRIKRTKSQTTMDQPTIEVYQPAIHNVVRILPVYQTIKGLSQKELRKMMTGLLTGEGQLKQAIENNDPFPKSLCDEYELVSRANMIGQLHRPESYQTLAKAMQRARFEEFFWFRVMIDVVRGTSNRSETTTPMQSNESWINEFEEQLPFQLTAGQQAVISAINDDVQTDRVMNRLVHGDVGSGKTMVALVATIQAIKNNGQVAVIAPTEVLAKQHAETMMPYIEQAGYKATLLTGSTTAKNKRLIKESIAQGEVQVLIGTHALFQDDVQFADLRLVITDEQHRFGVKQRALLKNRGEGVHYLVMSATPIPRTIALVAYGDLDISVIKEKPKNRKPIKTYCIDGAKRQRAYGFVKECVTKGEQAYVICPLVEENELLVCQSAVELHKFLKKEWLCGIKVGLLHGKMRPKEKIKVIEQFEAGEVDVLVSTTVVEVGVDVPNATVMIIENAERFGLAQLHQLRGRVGRNGLQAHCVLVSDSRSEAAKERLKYLTQSTDGFAIAERDLELRGPGDFIGVRQHGVPMIDFSDVVKENTVFEQAGEAAKMFLEYQVSDEYKGLRKEAEKRLENVQQEIIMN